MSDQSSDPRLQQPGASDESLLAAHEHELAPKPDDGGHYKLLPLILLFVFSGLIFYAGTYLNRYSGRYDISVFNENGHPSSGKGAAVKIDPLVLGKRNYEQVCITCHQATGKGVEGVYPPLAGSEWVSGSEQRIVRIVLHGLRGPIKVKGQPFELDMPALGVLDDDQIATVLTYIRAVEGISDK